MMKKVAVIGIQGLPANYGGFESLVENLVRLKSDNIEYTVYCSSKDLTVKDIEFKGTNLKFIPLKANGIQSILYDIVSLIYSMNGFDTILILGVSGCIFLPIFKTISNAKIIVNIDGLEHKRDKWSILAKKFLLLSERIAVKFADIIISDNKAIQEYVFNKYSFDSKMIPYGGDHVLRQVDLEFENDILEKYSISKENYAFSLCRIEPENNCHLILEAFKTLNMNLVFVGNWNRNMYGTNLKNKYGKYKNILMLDPIYDLDVLFVLRKNSKYYIHGHSAGGTNPSLVEAMFFGKTIIAYDVIYNRETTENKTFYFKDSSELEKLLLMDIESGIQMRELANKKYKWKQIVSDYEILY